MDTKKQNVVDVSCFFIFEATGDSEADDFVDPNKARGATTIYRDGYDVNDAESCSHDVDDGDDDDDSSDDNYFSFVDNGRSCFYDDNNVQVCIVDGKEEEGEEADSYYSAWPHEPHNDNGYKISGDSSHEELLSEMEKNKLFWETCLAS